MPEPIATRASSHDITPQPYRKATYGGARATLADDLLRSAEASRRAFLKGGERDEPRSSV